MKKQQALSQNPFERIVANTQMIMQFFAARRIKDKPRVYTLSEGQLSPHLLKDIGYQNGFRKDFR